MTDTACGSDITYLGLIQPLSKAVHRYLATFLCHQHPSSPLLCSALLYLCVWWYQRLVAKLTSAGGFQKRKTYKTQSAVSCPNRYNAALNAQTGDIRNKRLISIFPESPGPDDPDERSTDRSLPL